jgi:hypothetical protein
MPDIDDEVAEEVDDVPSWVKEGTEDDEFAVGGEDIHAAEQFEGSDVIEPAKGVEVFIKSIRLNVYTPKDKKDWKVARLEPMIVVGSKGVDGKGKYKNKHFFPSMVCAVNRESKEYNFTVNSKGKKSKYWQPDGNAFGDYNAFLTALGIPTSPAPYNDNKFRKSLVGRSLIVDITKETRQVKDETGEYVYAKGEFENKLLYRGAPKAASQPEVAEAAAS